MDENTAPVPARASRSLVVQSQISTWNPKSAIRPTRSMIGSSRKTISAHTASSTDHDPNGVPGCCCRSMSCDPFSLRTPLAGLTRASGTLERGQELLGVLGPAERLTASVPPVAEATDGRDQLLHAGEVAAAQRLAFDDGEAHLDQVQPRGVGRGEMQPDPRMLGQPCLHPLVLVGGVVVQHDMQLPTGIG